MAYDPRAPSEIFRLRLFGSEAYDHGRQLFHLYLSDAAVFIKRDLLPHHEFQRVSALQFIDAAEIQLSRAVASVGKHQNSLFSTRDILSASGERENVLAKTVVSGKIPVAAILQSRMLIVYETQHPIVVSEVQVFMAPWIAASVRRILFSHQAYFITVVDARDSRQAVLKGRKKPDLAGRRLVVLFARHHGHDTFSVMASYKSKRSVEVLRRVVLGQAHKLV